MSVRDHVKDVAFAASIPTDMILGTFTGSLNVAAPGTVATAKVTGSVSVPTAIPEKTLFQGIFSIDGGVTWTDFNSNLVNNTYLPNVALQTQMMYGTSLAGRLVLYADNWNIYTGSGFVAAAYTFQYKVVLFRIKGQGDVISQPVGQRLNFSARYNYQKIYIDSKFDFNFAIGTTTAVLAHNLGYVPKIRSYVDNFSFAAGSGGDSTALYDFGYWLSLYNIFQLYIDETNVYYYIDNSLGGSNLTGTLYTRVYFDS